MHANAPPAIRLRVAAQGRQVLALAAMVVLPWSCAANRIRSPRLRSRKALTKGHPSNPRPSAELPPIGGFFITTNPDCSRYLTSRRATISAMNSSALWTRLRLLKRRAKARALARSSGSAGVKRSRASGMAQ
jgi:hypothetical protein